MVISFRIRPLDFRKRLILYILLISTFIQGVGQSHLGTLDDYTFYSQALNKEMTCRVYLPPQYDPSNSNLQFPVIYSLHGATSLGYQAYDLIYPLIDVLWYSHTVAPFILVMPDGRAEPYSGSMYTNSVLYGNYQDYLVADLIPFIDSTFHTLNNKYKRAIMGHSMGSYGAFKMALQYPNLFIGVAGHSGPLNINMLTALIPDLEAENGGTPPYHWEPTPGKTLTRLGFTMAGAFSPNLSDPYFVDFPLDSLGNIRQDVMERWLPHNISEIARTFSPQTALGIYFDCGNQDDFHLQFQNRAFSDTLQKYGIHHQYQEYNGDHNSGLPFRIPIALRFIDQLFKTVASNESIPIEKTTIGIFPNPCSEHFQIAFAGWNETSDPITVTCSDLTGKVVIRSLIHSNPMLFKTENLVPGLYFLTLQSGGRLLKTEKLIIL